MLSLLKFRFEIYRKSIQIVGHRVHRNEKKIEGRYLSSSK